ncbi:hypothetical protein C0416_04155 [bacterium]|nr:hypothetical protein [bacterium]
MGEPLKIRPHHAEGAQRYIAWGRNESHEIMLDLLQNALNEDPEAELIFVKNYDTFCKNHCLEEGKTPECIEYYGSESFTTEMDEDVAREHGWEFDKPYKIKDVLDELKEEASQRVFYVCKLTHDEYEEWLKGVRASKKEKPKSS